MSTDTTDNPEVIEEKPAITIGAGGGETIENDLEDEFEKFNQTSSSHQAEESSEPGDPTEIDLSSAENFKLQLFMGFVFELIDGIHVFIYGFMSKYKLDKEDIGLDENDKEGLQMYFRTERVMNLINRIPSELMGFIHMEYLYFQKFREFNKKMKEQNPEEEQQVEDAEAEEVEEIDEVEKKLQEKFNNLKTKFAKKDEGKKPDTNSSTSNTKESTEQKKAAPKKAAKKAAPKKAVKKAAPKKVEKK